MRDPSRRMTADEEPSCGSSQAASRPGRVPVRSDCLVRLSGGSQIQTLGPEGLHCPLQLDNHGQNSRRPNGTGLADARRSRKAMTLTQGAGRAGMLALALGLGLVATCSFVQRAGHSRGAHRLTAWREEAVELQQGRAASIASASQAALTSPNNLPLQHVSDAQQLPQNSRVRGEAAGAEKILEAKKREREALQQKKELADKKSDLHLAAETKRAMSAAGGKKQGLHLKPDVHHAANGEVHDSNQDADTDKHSERPLIDTARKNDGFVTREAERQVADALAKGDTQTRAIISHRLTKELSHVISKIVQKVAAQQSESPPAPRKQQKVAVSRSNSESAAFASNSDVPSQAEIAAGEEEIHAAGQEASKVIDATPLAAAHHNHTKSEFTADIPGEPGEQGPVVGLEYKRIPLTYLTWFVAAMCVVATMLISTNLILKHLDYYGDPSTQKYVVRLLFMAPIYAVDSLIALTFVGWTTTYIDVFRDCYEAFTIYNFLKLLIVLLGGEKSVIEMLSRKQQVPLLFPLCYDSWEMGAEVFYNCKYGVLQYVLVKPACALVTFVSGAAGIYGANTFSLARLHFYVFLLSNISQMWALYCLLMFYMVCKQELYPFNPVLKFVIVKAVVFFCFWQGVVLGILAFSGYIPSTRDFSSESLTEAIQEVLVCLEMVFISILFHYAFPIEEFVDVDKINELRQQEQRAGLRSKIREIRNNVSDPFRVQDVRDDIFNYTNEQQDKFYGAVTATQEGISNVLLSARSSKQGASPGKQPEMWTDASMSPEPSEKKP